MTNQKRYTVRNGINGKGSRAEYSYSPRVEGNLAVREDDWYFEERRKRRTARMADRAMKKALLMQTRVRAIAATIVTLMIIVSSLVLLQTMAESSRLSVSISSLEAEIAELTEQNDSREYEIDSNVDLDYVIDVATNELGMVRSSVGQIVTYGNSDSEYLQQVSEIPSYSQGG